jgi:hypothetical protein
VSGTGLCGVSVSVEAAVKLRQVELFDAESRARMFCWVPVDPRIKPRAILTLKDVPSRTWIVMKVYETVRTDDDQTFTRGWKVGGLT